MKREYFIYDFFSDTKILFVDMQLKHGLEFGSEETHRLRFEVFRSGTCFNKQAKALSVGCRISIS
jgi:hypothetical protein